MSGSKWILEVYLVKMASVVDHIATIEFDSLVQLRLALARTHDRKYIVELPADASAADRITLLDLRAQGIDIAIRAYRGGL